MISLGFLHRQNSPPPTSHLPSPANPSACQSAPLSLPHAIHFCACVAWPHSIAQQNAKAFCSACTPPLLVAKPPQPPHILSICDGRTFTTQSFYLKTSPPTVTPPFSLSIQAWTSRTTFILASIGCAVGIGNIWRFPYMCYRNGGAAFMIPYLVSVFTLGYPLFVLETSLGQGTGKSPVGALGALCPRLKGLAWLGFSANACITCYYMVMPSPPPPLFSLAQSSAYLAFLLLLPPPPPPPPPLLSLLAHHNPLHPPFHSPRPPSALSSSIPPTPATLLSCPMNILGKASRQICRSILLIHCTVLV